MAFAYKNYNITKTSANHAATTGGIRLAAPVFCSDANQKTLLAILPKWLNLGNYSTSGTSSTSGTGGTTIIAAGNYTWIG